MNALLFVLAWIGLALIVFFVAILAGRKTDEKPTYRNRIEGGGRFAIALGAALLVIGIPAAVMAKSNDRIPSGAGTYTLSSTESEREGRVIFRETCASCHTLSAANARGVYGPDLDTTLAGTGADAPAIAARVEGAIKTGGATGKQMPANLLSGEDAKLVAEYVGQVAGK